jgi:hypothetical protein
LFLTRSSALEVVKVKLPREMTIQFSKYDQTYTDCAGAHFLTTFQFINCPFQDLSTHQSLFFCNTTENCLLRFIQLALLDGEGDGRVINSARARELGADDKICE